MLENFKISPLKNIFLRKKIGKHELSYATLTERVSSDQYILLELGFKYILFIIFKFISVVEFKLILSGWSSKLLLRHKNK